MFLRTLTIAIGSMLLASSGSALEIKGMPQIVDGDTVLVDGKRVRFTGIDAPETDQFCLNERGDHWNCGVDARDALVKKFGRQYWRCQSTENDAEGRPLATCLVEGVDVGKWLVSQGWALSFKRYSHVYDNDEDTARRQHFGLWAGSFIAPWEWSSRTCQTAVLTEILVSAEASKKLCQPSPTPVVRGCTIKASQRRKDCIYHMVGDQDYRITGAGALGPRWFCSVEEAEAAGCRHAKR